MATAMTNANPITAEICKEQIIEHGDRIVFVRIDHDPCANNPLEEQDGMGRIFSLGTRHANFNPDKISSLLETRPDDVVPLSYFEHGNSIWFPQANDKPLGTEADFRWDGVAFAGLWVPDQSCLDEIKDLTGDVRRMRLTELAGQVCRVYSNWCNGEVYCYVIEVYSKMNDKNGDLCRSWTTYRNMTMPIAEDSCGGYIGIDLDWMIQQINEAVQPYLPDLQA